MTKTITFSPWESHNVSTHFLFFLFSSMNGTMTPAWPSLLIHVSLVIRFLLPLKSLPSKFRSAEPSLITWIRLYSLYLLIFLPLVKSYLGRYIGDIKISHFSEMRHGLSSTKRLGVLFHSDPKGSRLEMLGNVKSQMSSWLGSANIPGLGKKDETVPENAEKLDDSSPLSEKSIKGSPTEKDDDNSRWVSLNIWIFILIANLDC